MRHCKIDELIIGGDAPIRLMGVINCSPESFYSGSYIPVDTVLAKAVEMIEQGADFVDIGARSTAPNVQPISMTEEASRMEAALTQMDGSGIPVSVDTMYPGVLEVCLRHDIHAVNDISGLTSPAYAKLVADSGLPAFLMASNHQPGDAVGLARTIETIGTVIGRCESNGIKEYVLDPGIGLWTALRSPENDWELCRNFERFSAFGHPVLAAVSRKSFIGNLINREPVDRLAGSLAVTVMLLQKGASVVRAHDVPQTSDVIRVFQRMAGGQ
jgi:dihydropteroate synthase